MNGEGRFFEALEQMVADSDFNCHTEELAQALAQNGNSVYRQDRLQFPWHSSLICPDHKVFFGNRYNYGHRSSLDPWPRWSGVKHGDELEFTFGHPLARPGLYTAPEVSLAHDILTYWINFVKTG